MRRLLGDKWRQRNVIEHAMSDCYSTGGWCLFMDELFYLTKTLGLRPELEMLFTQSRSMDVTLMGCTQRPSWVPQEAFANCHHMFLFRTGHEGDLIKVGSFNGQNAKLIARVVSELDEHEFLYVNPISGAMCRSRLDLAARPVTKGNPA